MSDQAFPVTTVPDTISDLQTILFPLKGAAQNTSPTRVPLLIPSPKGAPQTDPSKASTLDPAMLEPSTPETSDLAADSSPRPFWSLLSTRDLLGYTWFGPWAPPGANYTLPGFSLEGTSGKDFLTGDNRAEVIYGFDGRDLLMGEGGNDLIIGGADIDGLLGGPGNDVLLGGAGDDRVDGGPGNDWLNGGPGVDTLVGGQGRDVFAFFINQPQDLSAVPLSLGSEIFGSAAGNSGGNSAASSRQPDTITDFTPGEDLILIGGLLTATPPAGPNPFSAYVELTQLRTGTLVTVNQTTALGALVSTEIAVLNNISTTDLSASSFVFA